MIIDISVKNKIATLVDPNAYGVCHNGDYIVHFDFDSEWDEFATKTMRINYGGYSDSVIFSGTECALPIVGQPGTVEIGVFAGDLHTTTPATISFIKSITSASGPEPDPTPGVYAQIIKMLEDLSIGTSTTKDGTVVSPNADFAEVVEWADGNPDNEDRTGYFVCANFPVDGIVMKKATSIDYVTGVTIHSPAFAGNYTEDKLDSDGNLLPKYSYVAVIGFVPVIDNGTCEVGGRCMPDDSGCAIPSSNGMGYQVVNRIDENRVLIIIEPNGDMIQSVKTKINQLQEYIANLELSGGNFVSYSEEQDLTPEQKETARNNINAVDASLVMYDYENESHSDDRIPSLGATLDFVMDLSMRYGVVNYESQSLSPEQKQTARENIGAVSQDDFDSAVIDGIVVKDTTNSVDYIAKLRLVDGKPVIEYVEI